MNYDTDTKVIERGQIDMGQRKKSHISNWPLLLMVCAIVVFAIVLAAVIVKESRRKKPGVIAATYNAHALAKELVEPITIKAPPKFNHVIFRLGDAEIFRFTYENGDEGMRYSFEVKEGGT